MRPAACPAALSSRECRERSRRRERGEPGQRGLTAAQAQAILDDPLMILVNHTNKITEDYPVETKECGSATAINKTLQTVAADAFLSMQRPLPPRTA